MHKLLNLLNWEGILDVGDSMLIVPSNGKTFPNVIEKIFFSNDPSAMITSNATTIVVIEIYFVIIRVDVILETSIRLEETNTSDVTNA